MIFPSQACEWVEYGNLKQKLLVVTAGAARALVSADSRTPRQRWRDCFQINFIESDLTLSGLIAAAGALSSYIRPFFSSRHGLLKLVWPEL